MSTDTQTETVQLHTPPPAAAHTETTEKKANTVRKASAKTSTKKASAKNTVKRPAAKKAASKTSSAKKSPAKKAAAKNTVRRSNHGPGHKAQTQVPQEVFKLIKRDAKAEGIREADVVRNIIFKKYGYKPEAKA